MGIPRKQIGWGTESNLLWGIWNAIDKLTRVTSKNTPVSDVPSTPFKLISAATTNATVVKASAGNLDTITAISLAEDAVSYLKLYDKATAPVVGTDIPVMTIPIPTNLKGAGIVIPIASGIQFSNGISFAITSGVADSDTGAVVADEVIINLTYV
jgi:hypothetical protein